MGGRGHRILLAARAEDFPRIRFGLTRLKKIRPLKGYPGNRRIFVTTQTRRKRTNEVTWFH